MRWLLFGRSTSDAFAGEETAYWWPLYVDEEHEAETATAMLERTRARLAENGEDCWYEIAVVPAVRWRVLGLTGANEDIIS